MSLWKTFRKDVRRLMSKTHLTGAINLVRVYGEDASSGKNPCEKKSDENCTDDHPVARTREEAERDFPFYDMIKFSNEKCCEMICPDQEFPRFDDCFYEESDKNARKYQVTWSECPQVAIQPKKICCFEKATPRPILRRPPKFKPDTACKVKIECDDDLYCPRTTMPHCRPARVPPKCIVVRDRTPCTKIKAPYPSFSECRRPKLKGPKRMTECHCFEEIPWCILLEHIRRREKLGITGFTPCDK